MDLKRFYAENVILISITGKEYRGCVTAYEFPDDPNGESIILEGDTLPYPVMGFSPDEIASIVIDTKSLPKIKKRKK